MQNQMPEIAAQRSLEGLAIDRAVRLAVRDALLMHKRAGNPVAVWQEGKVVLVQPEDIVLPPEEDEA